MNCRHCPLQLVGRLGAELQGDACEAADHLDTKSRIWNGRRYIDCLEALVARNPDQLIGIIGRIAPVQREPGESQGG